MNRNKFVENVGQIAVRSDECFWIFPRYYAFDKEFEKYSPWFSYLGDEWQFIMLPISSYYNGCSFYLWRKFRHDLPGLMYTLQLKLKTNQGEQLIFREEHSNCDYGFHVRNFCSADDIRSDCITDCGQIKIFFEIKEMHVPTNIPQCLDSADNKSKNEINNSEVNDKKRQNASDLKGVDRLIENFRNILNDESDSDVILKTNDHQFHAHRVILRARSPVFASMLHHEMKEKKTGEVDISDCTTAAFRVFLHFLYTGKAETMSSETALDLYYIADKYQTDDLKSDCIELMKESLSVNNFCDVMSLSLRHSDSELQKFATTFFCRNVKKIVKTVQWQKYIKDYPIQANELIVKAVNA